MFFFFLTCVLFVWVLVVNVFFLLFSSCFGRMEVKVFLNYMANISSLISGNKSQLKQHAVPSCVRSFQWALLPSVCHLPPDHPHPQPGQNLCSYGSATRLVSRWRRIFRCHPDQGRVFSKRSIFWPQELWPWDLSACQQGLGGLFQLQRNLWFWGNFFKGWVEGQAGEWWFSKGASSRGYRCTVQQWASEEPLIPLVSNGHPKKR